MSVSCPACFRRNPAGARYCHHDGVALPGSQSAAPIAVGSRPFLSPFVFPSGRSCNTFDELVRGCEAEWGEARDMLRSGLFQGFLGSLGRADLALAARQYANEPDLDQGLDAFLSRLPGQRTAASLTVEPREINLGVLRRHETRSFILQIENTGRGLLGGAARSEVPWLVLGEPPGTAEKHFHCRQDLALPVRARGPALRAGNKPQEGRLVVAAGAVTIPVVVRVVVPVVPFGEGTLAGATAPRQLAEKARDNPREAAALFESGAVPRWYESNGWTYPVVGPAASGKAAVQQYFEALGLTRPPKLTINQTAVELVGVPGGSVEHFLIVETPENRPVYARAVSEIDWLEIGRVKIQGPSARIHLRVPRVPARPGEHLRGRVVVTGNGNQHFIVAVSLQVQGLLPSSRVPPPVRRAAVTAEPVAAVEVVPASVPVVEAAAVVPLRVEAAPVASIRTSHVPPPVRRSAGPGPTAAPLTAAAPVEAQLEPVRVVPETVHLAPGILPVTEAAPAPPVAQPLLDEVARPRRRGGFFHLMPLLLILLVLGGTVLHDWLLPSRGDEADEFGLIDTTRVLELRFNDDDSEGLFKDASRNMSFGLALRAAGSAGPRKRLLYDERGRTNNVCVHVDGQDFLFGYREVIFPTGGPEPRRFHAGVGRWLEMRTPLGRDGRGRVRDGARSVFQIDGAPDRRIKVEVAQTVEIVPGEQSGRLDTCLVRYTLRNLDREAHTVGIRFLLDTYIGDNDGVPFTIPGQPRLCSTRRSFDRPEEVPDYIQALEKDDLLEPGTVAHLQFRLKGALESPSRVFLGGYPDAPLRDLGYEEARGWLTGWEVPRVSIRTLVEGRERLRDPRREVVPDSAVTLYWDARRLGADERREVGFSYGLGEVASREGAGKLLLSVGGRTVRDGEFGVTALRASPVEGEKLTLRLSSSSLELLGPASQEVPPVPAGAARPISTVTWRLRARHTGRFGLVVESTSGVRQKQTVLIHPPATGVLD